MLSFVLGSLRVSYVKLKKGGRRSLSQVYVSFSGPLAFSMSAPFVMIAALPRHDKLFFGSVLFHKMTGNVFTTPGCFL